MSMERIERLWIEAAAAWTRGFKASEHAVLFGTTRATVQARLKRYRDIFREAMRYDPRTKAKTFPIESVARLSMAPTSLWKFCDFLRMARELGLGSSGALGSIRLCDLTDFGGYRSAWSAEAVELCRALSGKMAIDIKYVSKNKVSRLVFSPHSIVRTTQRIHFRGYGFWSEERAFYVDIVPARVLHVHGGVPGRYVGIDGDEAWHRLADVKGRLVSNLPGSVAEALLAEYGGGFTQEGVEVSDRERVFSFGRVPEPCARYALAAVSERRVEGYSGPVLEAWVEPVVNLPRVA